MFISLFNSQNYSDSRLASCFVDRLTGGRLPINRLMSLLKLLIALLHSMCVWGGGGGGGGGGDSFQITQIVIRVLPALSQFVNISFI